DAEILVFGCRYDDPVLQSVESRSGLLSCGVLDRRGLVGSLLNEVDVFADLSAYQAMGLTAIEAMASGAAAIVPRRGGAQSYARDRQNALVVDTDSREDCARALNELLQSAELRRHIQSEGMRDACALFPERAAFKILEALFD